MNHFFQFGIEGKVEYDPIQKYLAASRQKELGFTEKQIARNFDSLTEGKVSKVKTWIEVYEYMDEYLEYIGESGIYTSLQGREEAFLNLNRTIKGLKGGRTSSKLRAITDKEIDDLKIIYYNYILLNVPTHDVRLFKEVFTDKENWERFNKSALEIINDESVEVKSYDEYRKENESSEESKISKIRQNDFSSKFGGELKRLYGKENARIQGEKAQEYPIDILKTIQRYIKKTRRRNG